MYSDEPFEPKIFDQYFKDRSKLETLDNPMCIMGVPDLTKLGKWCTGYLIKELEAEKIVAFFCSDFEPISVVEKQDNIAELAKIEFYVVKNSEISNDFIIITGDTNPKSPIGLNFLADKIAEFISSFNPHMLISIATIPLTHPIENPRSYLAYTSEELQEFFQIDKKTHRNTNLKLQTLERGVVIGLNGLTVAYAKELYNISGGVLLSETFKSNETDYVAVKAILNIFDIIFDLQLSYESLELDRTQNHKKKPEELPPEDEVLKKVRRRIQS